MEQVRKLPKADAKLPNIMGHNVVFALKHCNSYMVIDSCSLICLCFIDEIYALQHGVRSNIISTISLNLSSFHPMFVERQLISSATASDIMTTMGTSSRNKAGEFVRSVEVQLQSSKNPQEVFEQFLSILTKEGAKDLAKTIMENYGKETHTLSST